MKLLATTSLTARSLAGARSTVVLSLALFSGVLFSGVLFSGVLFSGTPFSASAQEPGGPGLDSAVERGRYLVEGVALCGQCHTPRTSDGGLDRTRWLRGAPVPVENPAWSPRWAYHAPSIVNMIGYSEQEAVRLLTTGVARDGEPPAPPMPPFRMSEDDARAVFAYLGSL